MRSIWASSPTGGGSSWSSASRIESIERIDFTGSGNNTLTLTVNYNVYNAGVFAQLLVYADIAASVI